MTFIYSLLFIYIIYICILFLFPCLHVGSIFIALSLSSKNAIIVNTILLLSKEFISRKEVHKSIILSKCMAQNGNIFNEA